MVVDYRPPDVRDFVSLKCANCDQKQKSGQLCPSCSAQLEHCIEFSLLVFDGSAYMSVGCAGDDARYLFNGIDLTDSNWITEVKRYLRAIETRQLFEFCVERFVDDGEVCFRMFNTTFV